MERTPAALAKMIDHTLLKPNITNEEMKQACDVARAYGFKSVAMNAAMIPFAARELAGSGVLCDSAVGFPLGQCTIETKAFEIRDAVKTGAKELDMVINIGWVKDGKYDDVLREINTLKEACEGRILKVIIETCLLTKEEIVAMCDVVNRSNADFIKTSTGFSTGGATFEDVALMHEHMKNGKKVKASGGISGFEDGKKFIELGAERLGTSRLVKQADSVADLDAEF